MAIGRQGNSYAINSGNLPFAAPKKTNTKARDTFHKNNPEIEPPKAPEIVEVKQVKPEIEVQNKQPEPVETLENHEIIEESIETVTKIEEPEIQPNENISAQKEDVLNNVSTIELSETKQETSPIIPENPQPAKDRNFKNSSAKLTDYTGVRKNTTFAFCDSNDISYIKIKANRLGMTYQDYLAEILLENIETIKADEFDYTEQTYQNTKRGLKNPVNDRFALKEDFLIDVKQAAANVGMKRSAFVAMCVHKARIADPNPAWDL